MSLSSDAVSRQPPSGERTGSGYDDLVRLHLRTLDILELLLSGFDELRRTAERLDQDVREVVMRLEAVERRSEKSAEPPIDYVQLCHAFRGTFGEIKERQRKYLDHFLGRQCVLDIGSGRGEFLELMAEHGIEVVGAELDVQMAELGRRRGHHVVQADVLDYLDAQPDGVLDGIFAAHVAEHIAPERLYQLLRLAGGKLRAGAPVVVETVNPFYSDAFNNFFIDPSHVRPLPPQILRFMLEVAPYEVEHLVFSSPTAGQGHPTVLVAPGELPAEVRSYQDYAAVARRR